VLKHFVPTTHGVERLVHLFEEATDGTVRFGAWDFRRAKVFST